MLRSSRRLRPFIRTLAAAATFVVLLGLPALEAGGQECHRMEPSLAPSWVLGGAWAQDGSLLLLEPSTSRVLRYDASIPGVATMPGRMEDALANLQARSMHRAGDGYVFLLPQSIFVQLDSRFRMVDMVRLTAPGGFDEIFAFQWNAVGDDIVVCGDVDPPGESDYPTGLFRFSLSDPGGTYEMLQRMGAQSPMALYCRLGLSLITGVGDVPVVLYFGESVELLAFPGGKKVQLDVIPNDFTQAPRLDPNPERGQFAFLMREIEQAQMPYGVFSDGTFIYLLLRSPAAGGGEWRLSRVSLQDGVAKVHGTSRIPSRARHLTVVPGPEQWAFLEKGEVRKMGEQPVEDILLIPTERIAGITVEGQLLCE